MEKRTKRKTEIQTDGKNNRKRVRKIEKRKRKKQTRIAKCRKADLIRDKSRKWVVVQVEHNSRQLTAKICQNIIQRACKTKQKN